MTGASDGIGRAVASELGRRGEPVVAVARARGRLERLAAEVPAVTPVAADLATVSGREVLFAACAPFATVDSLIHGAGSRVSVAAFDRLDPEALVEDFRIHVAAVIALTQHFAARNVGRVIVFDSYAATAPRVGWAGYSVVKAAAQMVARSASAELQGAAVLRLYPGAVRTPLLETMLESDPSPARDVYRRMERDGQVATVDEIGTWVADVVLGDADPAVRHFGHVGRNLPQEGSGSCLCGGVRYVIRGPMRDVVQCHCVRCRKTSGHHLAASAARIDDIRLEAADTLEWFAPEDDPTVRYGFCRHCGSSLFWHAEGSDSWSVGAGTLDQPTGLQTQAAWHTESVADYQHLDPSLPSYPREP